MASEERGVWFISRAGGDYTVSTLCIFVSLNLLAITVPPSAAVSELISAQCLDQVATVTT